MKIAKKLNELRKLFGFSLQDVCNKTKISKPCISDFENDKREPSLAQLQTFADLYHKPISFFFNDELVFHPRMLWRKKPENKQEQLDIELKFYQLCKQYMNLENWSNFTKKNNFKNLQRDFPKNETEVRKIAKEIEDLFHSTATPWKSLLEILENDYYVKIFHYKFNGSAISFYGNTIGPAIMLNTNNVGWRRNFDLAHELFHLITWDFEKQNDESTDIEEKFADIFASEFLMPEIKLKQSIEETLQEDRKISDYTINKLANQYDVSYEALIRRINKVYNINLSNEKINDIVDKVKEVYPISERKNKKTSMFPERYENQAIDCLRKGKMSTAQCARYLNKSVSELMAINLYDGEEEYDIQIPNNLM